MRQSGIGGFDEFEILFSLEASIEEVTDSERQQQDCKCGGNTLKFKAVRGVRGHLILKIGSILYEFYNVTWVAGNAGSGLSKGLGRVKLDSDDVEISEKAPLVLFVVENCCNHKYPSGRGEDDYTTCKQIVRTGADGQKI